MITFIAKDAKITLEKYVMVAKNVPWILARHAFLWTLFLVALGAAAGTLLFYAYVFLPAQRPVEPADSLEIFQESLYRSVLESWKTREAITQHSGEQSYKNPF